ncbi:hypothetical protein BKA93DRAFT_753601 [Sparassis latifolia]
MTYFFTQIGSADSRTLELERSAFEVFTQLQGATAQIVAAMKQLTAARRKGDVPDPATRSVGQRPGGLILQSGQMGPLGRRRNHQSDDAVARSVLGLRSRIDRAAFGLGPPAHVTSSYSPGDPSSSSREDVPPLWTKLGQPPRPVGILGLAAIDGSWPAYRWGRPHEVGCAEGARIRAHPSLANHSFRTSRTAITVADRYTDVGVHASAGPEAHAFPASDRAEQTHDQPQG